MKTSNTKADFDRQHQTHLKHLKLKGLQPKTQMALHLLRCAHGDPATKNIAIGRCATSGDA